MILARLKDVDKIIIDDSFKHSSICTHEDKTYFVYNEINKLFLKDESKDKSFRYYLAMQIHIIDDHIEIYNENLFVLFISQGVIEDVVNFDDFKIVYRDISFMKDNVSSYILNLIDYDSKWGREILLYNFFSKNNMPNWINNKVEEFPSYVFRRKVNESRNAFVDLNKIVGTSHPDYNNKTWLEMYYHLKREGNIIKALLKPEYYTDILQNEHENKSGFSFVKIDDNYYISSGNHRTLLCKIKGLKYVYAPVFEYKTDFEYLKYYNELVKLNIEVSLPYNDLTRIVDVKLKERWEVFQVVYKGNIIDLVGLEEIREFYQKIISKEGIKNDISIFTKIKRLFNFE